MRKIEMERRMFASRIPWDALIAVTFVTIGAMGLRVVHDFELWEEVAESSASRSKVAIAIREKGEVRRRPGEAWVWRDLPSGSVELANGDSVFTGQSGEAELFFETGARVRLKPGSLVVVRVERKAARGLEWLRSLKRIIVPERRVQEQVVEVRAGSAEVRAGSEALTVRTSDGRELTVAAGESRRAETLAPAVSEIPEPFVAQEPAQAAPVPVPAPARPPRTKTLKVSRSAQVLTRKKAAPARVRGAASQGTTRLEDDLDRINVMLKWEPVEGADEFKVKLYSGTGSLIHETMVRREIAEVALRDLDGTDYSYEVEAHLRDGGTIASGRIPLEIRLAAPEPVSPAPGEEFEPGSKTLLTWERTALTRAYRVVVAADPKFQRVIVDHTGAMNLFVLRPERTGTLFWRVQSVGQKWKSDWSGTRSFVVK